MAPGSSGEEERRVMAMKSSAYCYSGAASLGGNQNLLQDGGVIDEDDSNPEIIYNLAAGMEMVGFRSKIHLHQEQETTNPSPAAFWRDHFTFPHGAGASSSSSNQFNPGLSDPMIFSCEGSSGTSQIVPGRAGLSLSLSSSANPCRAWPQPQAAHMVQGNDFYFGNSKFLGPAQELLNEFCNLGTKRSVQKCRDENDAMVKQSLFSFDLLELQERKIKLLQLLEEVDRRYRNYCDHMKAVVSSFDAVAGAGAATVYTALASRAMSRHFRCLRDETLGQIKATKKAMGEREGASPGASKGETPRLRILDQAIRQQRSFKQMAIMESHPWRPQRGLPERSVSVLRAWLFEHFLNPYPNDVDKLTLARQTGLSRSQVSNWFINARVRLWKPMVEEMYLEELKDQDGMPPSDIIAAANLDHNLSRNEDDRKPTHDQLHSDYLSSIKALQNEQHHSFGRLMGDRDAYGTTASEASFPPYPHPSATASAAAAHHSFGGSGSGSGVSLTLGLQQQEGGACVTVAFSPTSQSSYFYPRFNMEDCQTVQYTLLEGENQALSYRNSMGTQLLHDLV